MILVAVALAGILAGCAPASEPSPDSTGAFADEAEAFAAAEETYRAYVDALNAVDLGDPETFEDVYAWTTGEANSEIRTSLSGMHADGLTVSGQSEPTLVEPRTYRPSDTVAVDLAVCLNVGGVELVDTGGQSVVSEDRPDVQSLLVTFTGPVDTTTQFAISSISGRDGAPSCD